MLTDLARFEAVESAKGWNEDRHVLGSSAPLDFSVFFVLGHLPKGSMNWIFLLSQLLVIYII